MEDWKAPDVKKTITILEDLKERDLALKIRIHFEDVLDEDYSPPKRRLKKEYYSDSEGSAEEEYTYATEDEEGFLSLA